MLTVFGSIIVDSIFSVPSLPKEGETVLATDLFVGPGGKGANQAVAAAKALGSSGGRVAMVGSVGSDASAKISMEAFASAGVDVSSVQSVDGPTGSAAVMVDASGANAISVAPAANRQTCISQMTGGVWGQATTLLMQMEIPFSELEAAIFEAKKRGVRSILNLAPAAPLGIDALKALDILIVNEVELEMLAEILGLGTGGDEELAKKAAQTLGNIVVVTLGSEGALLVSGGEVIRASALAITALDTTGAGDAFCGVFAASLDAGQEPEEALKRGCIAGSRACLKTGAQESHPGAEEISRAVSTTCDIEDIDVAKIAREDGVNQ